MLTVSIQAGGQSTRMGEDKALKPFLGRPLVQRVIDRLSPIADEIIVTTNRPEDYAFLNTSTALRQAPQPVLTDRPGKDAGTSQEASSMQRLRLFPDLIPGRGALGGLYTALASATSDLVAVVACDMPFASSMLLETAARLMVQEDADVVIAETADGMEPLHAVYRRVTCVPAIEAAIAADKWRVISWFPQVKVRVLKPEELKQLDPSGLCFWNLNTPEEFIEAERVSLSLLGRGPA
ncbi:MAG: molybdenum cofactor guanylyltransferase [Chloroflexi bacterium]|nr:molybdenum cofactor guanylyltransferase [Chloroflexota bacterium]